MKISLIAVGKQDVVFKEAVIEYTKRLSRYANFELIETTDEKLPTLIEKYDRIFLLDEYGKEYDSISFSDVLQKQLNAGVKDVCFVIGGAYGFDAAIQEKADGIVSLSKLTFPHQLARVIFLEQLYRGFTILKNERYHHE